MASAFATEFYITVTVVASNASGSSAPAQAQFTTAVDHAGTAVSVETALPIITGTAQVGDMLTCSTGTWSGSSSSFARCAGSCGERARGGAAAVCYPEVTLDDITVCFSNGLS